MSIINTGITPSSIAINNNYAYITNSNNYEIPGQDSVTVVDLSTNLPITTIFDPSFNEPYRVTICGTKAYIMNSGGSTISIINTKTNKVSGIITGFDGPSGMVIKDNIGYVNNYGATPGVGSGNGTTVSVVDLNTNLIINTIIVGFAPAAVVSGKKYIYTVNYVDGNPDTGTLSKICPKNNKVIATITGFFGPFSMAIKDGKGYVTNFGSNNFAPFGTSVSVVDLKQNIIIDTITVGIQPTGIAIHNNYAYVSNYNTLYAKANFQNLTFGQGIISVIDLSINKVVSNIPTSPSPNSLVINKNSLYVVNYTQNCVNVIDIDRR